MAFQTWDFVSIKTLAWFMTTWRWSGRLSSPSISCERPSEWPKKYGKQNAVEQQQTRMRARTELMIAIDEYHFSFVDFWIFFVKVSCLFGLICEFLLFHVGNFRRFFVVFFGLGHGCHWHLNEEILKSWGSERGGEEKNSERQNKSLWCQRNKRTKQNHRPIYDPNFWEWPMRERYFHFPPTPCVERRFYWTSNSFRKDIRQFTVIPELHCY